MYGTGRWYTCCEGWIGISIFRNDSAIAIIF